MRVEVPILTAHGAATYEVDAKNQTEAREKIQRGEARFLTTQIVHYKLNFDAIREVPRPDVDADAELCDVRNVEAGR